MHYNFGPASIDEPVVFGAARPAALSFEVAHWISFMKDHGVRRVCCLLDDELLEYRPDLIELYRQEFGSHRVCHAPIQDFSYCSSSMLTDRILPFLFAADHAGERVVVHCSAGCGRTGHILAAWLIAGRGLDPSAAQEAIMVPGALRSIYEGGDGLDQVFACALQFRKRVADTDDRDTNPGCTPAPTNRAV